MQTATPSPQTPPHTPQDLATGLRSVGYLPGSSTPLVAYLAIKLGKPVLVEGPAGVGKTELAKALATHLNRTLVRLQCYEGLDEAKALYEWNYRKQLLRIQTETQQADWQDVQEDIFGEEFLLPRPLMTAIAATDPVVLLIDEIDKTDQEFEAMLLELLSDFQISIPELGRIEARTHPVVVLTSNNSRELTEALKRRCLYLWLDYPTPERELEIVRLHAPELPDAVAALGEVDWRRQEPFREALAATLAKSPEDRRIFDLVFERYFFRAAEGAALEQGIREGPDETADGITGGERIDYEALREQIV